MSDLAAELARRTVSGLKTLLPGHKIVILIETPDAAIYFGSNLGDVALAETVCCAGYQLAQRCKPVVTPTHEHPEMVQ